MKLYISADIEGISGVTCDAHAMQTGAQFADARKWMTGDVNAAIEGACEAGVTEICVKDAHGWALNILQDEIDQRATLIQGWGPEDGMMEGLTGEHDIAFLVGYHPMAGTPDGVLSHTWTGSLRSVVFNGIEIGEMGISGLFAGAHDVPIGMISTCAAGEVQAKELLPWVETAVVKRGITRFAAELLPITRAQGLIRGAAKRAVERMAEMEPLKQDEPCRVRATWDRTGQADSCATDPEVERVDAYTVELEAADQLGALRTLRRVLKLG
ncbi:MAG TPA: M55 family metallopeptidase [Armatimonadota bacterium]|nr:M55 family metallopeptidase [Armatimonadota bacterium]